MDISFRWCSAFYGLLSALQLFPFDSTDGRTHWRRQFDGMLVLIATPRCCSYFGVASSMPLHLDFELISPFEYILAYIFKATFAACKSINFMLWTVNSITCSVSVLLNLQVFFVLFFYEKKRMRRSNYMLRDIDYEDGINGIKVSAVDTFRNTENGKVIDINTLSHKFSCLYRRGFFFSSHAWLALRRFYSYGCMRMLDN